MKIFTFFSFFFLFIVNINASEYTDLFISKKDIYTNEYISDCDFLLYDSNNNIIDSWISSDNSHHLVIKKGSYKLVERPLLEQTFSDELSKVYKLDVAGDEAIEFVLYNKKIETPRNLGFNNNYYLFGFLFIIFGLVIVIRFYRQFSKY